MDIPLSVTMQALRRHSAAVLVGLATLGVAGVSAANPNALWDIVHGQCVPNQQRNGDPKPCAKVSLQNGVGLGYAVLKDRVGATQFLLIPTAPISGIESPELRTPNAPNYFAAAWRARTYLEDRAHRPLPRESISLAVNSKFARSQNQLHIHIDCVRADVRDALREQTAEVGDRWAPLRTPLGGHQYLAIRLLGEELGQANPFKLLADGVPGAAEEMGWHTLVMTGATFPTGEPGFIVMASRADPALGDLARGENLQDHACALLDRGPAESSPR